MKLVAVKDAKWTGKTLRDAHTGVLIRIDGRCPWSRASYWEITGRQLDDAGHVTRNRWRIFSDTEDTLPPRLSVQP